MSTRIIFVISLVAFLGNQPTFAQEEQPFRKFYAGIELGAGGLELSRNQLNEGRTARFALGIYGGYRPFRWLRAGINLANNIDLMISLKATITRKDKKGDFGKDKSSEIKKAIAPEHATHGGEALDSLIWGKYRPSFADSGAFMIATSM